MLKFIVFIFVFDSEGYAPFPLKLYQEEVEDIEVCHDLQNNFFTQPNKQFELHFLCEPIKENQTSYLSQQENSTF